MVKRFKDKIITNYFGKQFPLDYRVYMIFFFESYFISILSATTNTILNKGILGIIFQWSYIIFCTVMVFMLPRMGAMIQKPHLLFVTFIYIPFLYFHTAGYDGTALLFAQLGLFLLGIVFSGKARVIIIALNVLDYLVCILLSHFFPQMVTPHSGPDALLIDLIVALILSFSGLAILTIYISKAYEDNSKKLAELSLVDSLTGIYNRRYMDNFLKRQLSAARQTESKFYVLMLDIDHFKKINDTYGHGFGDHVLFACARAIKAELKKQDVVVRYGGEEFVIFLISQAHFDAVEFAESIRKKISSLHFPNGVRITVSIGITASRMDDTIDRIINRADQGLYQAKLNGRNQVVVIDAIKSAD